MKKTLASLVIGAVLGSVALTKADSFTYSPVTNNTTLIPTEQTEYLVQASSGDSSKGIVSGNINDWIISNQLASVNANANSTNHFRFVNWTINGTPVSTSSNYSFNVTSPLTNLVANFDIERFNVDIQNGTMYGLSPTSFAGIAYGSAITSSASQIYYTNAPGVRKKIIGLQKQ